jgi:hypothetical protein
VVVVGEIVEESFDEVQPQLKKEKTIRNPAPKKEYDLRVVLTMGFIFF